LATPASSLILHAGAKSVKHLDPDLILV